jgi:hypothetical protein
MGLKESPGAAAPGAIAGNNFTIPGRIYDVNSLPGFFTREMKAAARRLADRGTPITLEAVGRQMRALDPRNIPDLERAFLSCILAGGDFCGMIGDDFLVPRHKILFAVLQNLTVVKALPAWGNNVPVLLAYLEAAGILQAAGGEGYVRGFPGACGIPSWAGLWARELRRVRREAENG